MSDDVTFLSQLVRDSMELQALEAINRTEDRETDIMKPLQVLNYLYYIPLNFSSEMSMAHTNFSCSVNAPGKSDGPSGWWRQSVEVCH